MLGAGMEDARASAPRLSDGFYSPRSTGAMLQRRNKMTILKISEKTNVRSDLSDLAGKIRSVDYCQMRYKTNTDFSKYMEVTILSIRN